MNILDGNIVSNNIITKVSQQVQLLNKKPCLAVLLASDDPASQIYVKNKNRMCEKAGVESLIVGMSNPTTTKILNQVQEWNENSDIDGIIVQLPLPKTVDKNKILSAVNPLKDVDGFHPENLGLLASGEARFLPCTVAAVLEIIKYYEIPTVGQHVVIINRSNVVGIPLAIVLARNPYNSTVSVCHEHTIGIDNLCKIADIIVTAVGQECFELPAHYLKSGAVVIDVGIRRKDKEILGDFRPTTEQHYRYTPVPGGVGPTTVACLIQNVVLAAQRKQHV